MNRQEFSDATVQLATRIPKGLHLRVRIRALDVGRTMADFVGEALTEHLTRCKREHRSGALKVAQRAKEASSDGA